MVQRSSCGLFLLALIIPASSTADSNAVCSWDETLSSAAAQLVAKGELPDRDALEREVRDAGSAAVGLNAIWVAVDDQKRVDIWLQKTRAKSDAPLVCGDAHNESGRLVIAEARAGSLATVESTSNEIRGWLIASFSEPELVFAYENGDILRYAIDRKRLEAGVSLANESPRPVQVQLVARGPFGPRPIAQRRISPRHTTLGLLSVNRKADGVSSSKTTDLDRSKQSLGAQYALWAQLDIMRKKRGIPDLRKNRLIEHVAAQHAQAVCDTGRAFHELEPGDDPEVRLAREGIRARIVGETIARSVTPDAAFIALTKSPAHKSTLLDPRFTDAGVGLSGDLSGKSCLVIVLAAWPRFVGR